MAAGAFVGYDKYEHTAAMLERGEVVIHEDNPLSDEQVEALFPNCDIHRIRRMTPEERLEMYELERVSTSG